MGWAPAQPWIRWADGWMGGWWMDYFRWYFHCWYIMICIMIKWGSLQHLKSLLPSGWIYRAQREESMTAAAKNKTKKRNTVNTFTCTTKLNVWLFLRVQGSFYKLSNEMFKCEARSMNDPQKWNSKGLHTQLLHEYSHGWTREVLLQLSTLRSCFSGNSGNSFSTVTMWCQRLEAALQGLNIRKLCEKYELFVRLSQSLSSFSVSPYLICNLKFKHRCLNVNCQCSINIFK